MDNSKASYQPLVGFQQGAHKIHLHVTELHREGSWTQQHTHEAEEAVFILEGEAEFTFAGKIHHVSPGELVFFPSGVLHAELNLLTETVKYLVVRSVESGDPPCCCGADRPDDER